jgi:TolA-binding protein
MDNINFSNPLVFIYSVITVVLAVGLVNYAKLLKTTYDYKLKNEELAFKNKKLELELKQDSKEADNNQIKTAFNLLQGQVQRLENELIKEKELARQNVRDYENTIKDLRTEFETKLGKHLERINQLEHIIYENQLGYLLKNETS